MSKPILLIDDEEKFAQMLQELLHIMGYEADYCLNPEEAVVRIRHENYDLVITDYKMPQMDGAQFLETARKVNPDLPVIMISGLMNMPELIKVANIGVTLVLEKPFNTEDLIEYVSRFVHPSSSDQVSAAAMDMEASEISFQQDVIETSYPSPSSFISDASNENKRFLEAMWKGANEFRHIPFFATPGAEVRLVAKEIMSWTGQDQDAEVVRIDLLDTDSGITRSWIAESEGMPGALLVDMRNAEWNEANQAKLGDWVDYLEGCGKDLSMSRILYVLPTGVNFDLEEAGLPEMYKCLFAKEFPVLLSLRERLLDTATYLNTLLQVEHRAILGSNGLNRLLHYSWPGGFMELQEKLSVVRERLEAGQQPDDAALKEILEKDSDDPSSLEGGLGLESYLKRRQREYVLLHREQGEDLKDTILRLGIDSDHVKVEDVLNDKELAFPDVITA